MRQKKRYAENETRTGNTISIGMDVGQNRLNSTSTGI